MYSLLPPPQKKINKKILGRKEHHNNFFSASKKYHLKAINNELRCDYAYKGAGRGARWAGSGRLCEDPGGPHANGDRAKDARQAEQDSGAPTGLPSRF